MMSQCVTTLAPRQHWGHVLGAPGAAVKPKDRGAWGLGGVGGCASRLIKSMVSRRGGVAKHMNRGGWGWAGGSVNDHGVTACSC